MILVTGAAGFIGSNFVRSWFLDTDEKVISFDCLTYAGNLLNLTDLEKNENHTFINGDIADSKKLSKILAEYQPRAVINFAAETHVDRSIENPKTFLSTNVMGTYNLLEACLEYWKDQNLKTKEKFCFLHISTDEVYGSLGPDENSFKETSQFRPNSPYSASKASSDHLVRSFFKTFGLPTVTSNCSNNYGPFQFPEKLIPMTICNLLNEKDVPIYGDGKQIRDWLHVFDHCEALKIILKNPKYGEVYNIGASNEIQNLEVVRMICSVLDTRKPRSDSVKYEDLISFVEDRLGHDRRYSIDSSKIKLELGWEPSKSFRAGIEETVQWYLDNLEWVKKISKQ